ncbi:uncharacterized protein NPIL_157971 [Nephila pilipes]|uniref:Uncharacterized protein n=1 Tax=Nephila pilipes TaxID=299642 RepID=A0A8X6QLV4_NEPPI|nr:uncharacterized protein NPIL_157971 [Nephila pilipes]
MNWMGGARNRVRAMSDKKKQKEFFQAKRRSAAQKSIIKNTSTIPALSHDLISFHLVERNLRRKIPMPKPTQVIKEDLEKRSSNIFDVDLSETPLERYSVGTNKNLPQGLKIKNSIDKINSEENGSDIDEMFHETALQNNVYATEKEFQKFLLRSGDNIGNLNKYKPQELNFETNVFTGSPVYSKLQTTYHYPKKSPKMNFSSPQDLIRTPDIHESFKKYINKDKMNQLENGNNNHYNSDFEYSETFEHNTLQKAFEKELLHEGKYSENSTINRKPSKKFKMFKNMNAVLSRHEQDEEINFALKNSQPTFSELSKCTFSSIPTKAATRDYGEILRNNDSDDRHSYLQSDSKSYREKLNELEKMIRKANMKRQKILKNSPEFEYSPQSNRFKNNLSSDFFQSPQDSTSSSSSSGMNIPTFFQRKRIHGDHHSINNCDVTSYKKIRRSVIDSNCFDIEVNRRKKIKISNTTVLTPKYSKRIDERHSIKYLYDTKFLSTEKIGDSNEDLSKPLFPPSFLSYFPTPIVTRSRNESNVPQESSTTKIISEQLAQILNDRKKDYNDKSFDENISFNQNYLKNYEMPERISSYNSTSNCSINHQNDYHVKENSTHNIPIVCTIDAATSPLPNLKYFETNSNSIAPKNSEKLGNESFFPEDNSDGIPEHNSLSEHVCDKIVYQQLDTTHSNDSLNKTDTSNIIKVNTFNNKNVNTFSESEMKVSENHLNEIEFQNDKFTGSIDDFPPTVPNTPNKYHKFRSKGKIQDELNFIHDIEDSSCPQKTVPNIQEQFFDQNSVQTDLIQGSILKHDILQERVYEEKETLFPDDGETMKTPHDNQLISNIDTTTFQTPNNSPKESPKRISSSSDEFNVSKSMYAIQDKLESSPFIVNISTYMNMAKTSHISSISSIKNNIRDSPSTPADNNPECTETVTASCLKSEDTPEKVMETSENSSLTTPKIINKTNSTEKEEKSNTLLGENSKCNDVSDINESKTVKSLSDTFINCTEVAWKRENVDTVLIASPEEVSSNLSDPEIYLNKFHNLTTFDAAVQVAIVMTDAWCQVG